MALAAAQVIDALAARLNGATDAGARVYTSRTWPLSEADLPAWRVTAEDESVDPATVHGINQHALLVHASASVRAVDDLDDAMHAIAEAGLTALFAGKPPHNLALDGIDRAISTEGECAVGVITLRLRCTFFCKPSAPGTLL